VGETRVDLQHLLEDLRDAYTGALEETTLTEVVANAPILLAQDRRFSAAVLLCGGLTFTFGKLPEVNAVNFLPRMTTPVLMMNGKYDSAHRHCAGAVLPATRNARRPQAARRPRRRSHGHDTRDAQCAAARGARLAGQIPAMRIVDLDFFRDAMHHIADSTS